AQDVAQQHPVPPGAVEGDRGRDGGLLAVPLPKAAPQPLLGVRDVQRAPGRRGLTAGASRQPSRETLHLAGRSATFWTGVTRVPGRPAGPGPVRIAIDLLGGDHAPAVVVDGALQACAADPDLQLLLVGPAPVADKVIAALEPPSRGRVSVLVVERGVAMAAPVTDGADPATTIGAAVRALGAGQVDALVSAGSSGAIVAASVLGLGRLAGVRRPALTAILPGGGDGPLVLLDVGAGMQVNPVDLVQHAILGAGYARLVAGVQHPRIGLLSVGAEPGKGDRL